MNEHPLSHDHICDHLEHHGWLGKDRHAHYVANAILAYQRYHGLKQDGDCGCVTQAQISRTVCGTRETDIEKARLRQSAGNGCQWPITCAVSLKYFADFSGIKGISEKRAYELYQESWDAWTAVCGIEAERTMDRSEAHFVVGMERMSGGTLAWSTLPCGYSCSSNGEQAYNKNVTWDEGLFLSTATHENGHQAGLDHNKSCSDLMCWTVNGNEEIGQWSIDRMVPKYGEPATPPINPPDTPAGFPFDINDRRFELVARRAIAKGERIPMLIGRDPRG